MSWPRLSRRRIPAKKKADAMEHIKCPIASAYSLTGFPAAGRITLYLVVRGTMFCQSAMLSRSVSQYGSLLIQIVKHITEIPDRLMVV